MTKRDEKRKWLKVAAPKMTRERPLVLLIIILSSCALFYARDFGPLVCLTNWIVKWDWGVYLLILCYYIFVYYHRGKTGTTESPNSQDTEEARRFERKLGAETVRAEITANITVAGILLAGIAIFLRIEEEALRPAILNQVYAAAGWLGGSLVIGLWNLSSATGLTSGGGNVARIWWPSRLLNVAQFYAIIFGLLRFLIGIATLGQST